MYIYQLLSALINMYRIKIVHNNKKKFQNLNLNLIVNKHEHYIFIASFSVVHKPLERKFVDEFSGMIKLYITSLVESYLKKKKKIEVPV